MHGRLAALRGHDRNNTAPLQSPNGDDGSWIPVLKTALPDPVSWFPLQRAVFIGFWRALRFGLDLKHQRRQTHFF